MKPEGRTLQITAIIAYLGILISLPLPWRTVNGDYGDVGLRISGLVRTGFQRDAGIMGAILGIIGLILIFKRSRWALFPCIAICGVALLDFDSKGISFGSTELGIGTYLFDICSLVLTITVILALKSWKSVLNQEES